MAELHTAHTADLDDATLSAVRALLLAAFEGDVSDHDVEHALGGLHVLLREGPAIVGHASVVQRRLLHGGRALRAGYVEAVAVGAGHRRRGHGSALMREVGRIVRGAYDLGALGATDQAVALYEAHGWRQWQGPLWALTPQGVVRTPDEEGGVYVLEARPALDRRASLTCDWRDGDVW